jgi:hypothetical protein
MPKFRNSRPTSLTVGSLLFACLEVGAQQPSHINERDSNQHRYVLAGFLGSTHVDGENESTLGVEGGYHISRVWSVGAVVERANRDRHSTLILAGVGWHPFDPALRFQLGAGVKDPSQSSELTIRLAVAYELEFETGWFIKPYLAADFIRNEDREVVFGAYLGRGF